MRFSHLSKISSWRRRFLSSLGHEVAQSHIYIKVQTLPPETACWQREVKQILESNVSLDTPKKKALMLRLLDLDNGDPSSESICHYCLPTCTHTSQVESLADLVRCYVELFSHFFDVPLVSRWKHAGPAIDYLKRGVLLHNILPRTLSRMSGSAGESQDLQPVLDQLQMFVNSAATESCKRDVLQDIHECEVSLASENAKRQRKTTMFFNQVDFTSQVRIMSRLLMPLDRFMDDLLHRTHDVHKLCSLVQHQSQIAGLTVLFQCHT